MSYTFEDDYLELMYHIMDRGEPREDRTGVGTKAIFGTKIVCDLREGFPILTTKRVPFKAVSSELLWFLEGSGDERRLAQILHGSRDESKSTIWTANAQASYWTDKAAYPGDLGRVYGVQWRDWQSVKLLSAGDHLNDGPNTTTFFDAKVQITSTDQVQQLVDTLIKDPNGRRHIITAWNPGELSLMALPPCHMFAQFYLSNKRELSCQMYMRSVDTFLGLPFNIASYALLTHIIAHHIGAGVGKLHIAMGDTHIYSNHFDAVQEMLSRPTRPIPKLLIKTEPLAFDGYKIDDFELIGYDPHPAIKAEMAV